MIGSFLHGRLLGAAPAGTIIAHPSYVPVVAIDTETDPATAIATATFTVAADGTWSATGTGHADASGLWYNPATAGIGSGYDVRITPTLTSGHACVVTNPVAAWTQISTDKVASFVLQMLAIGTNDSHYTVLVEMRPTGGGATISSASFALTVTAVVNASGGGSDGCVCPLMFIRPGLRARDARVGDLFDCIDLHQRGDETFSAPLLGMELAEVECVRICTDGGALLECSTTTPFDLLDGRTTKAPLMLGERVITDWGVETVTSITEIGLQLVCHNHLGGLSYAAGADPFHRIFSHNPTKH